MNHTPKEWNDLLKQCDAENRRQAELEAWWNRPVPMPKAPPPPEPRTPKRPSYDSTEPAIRQPTPDVQVPSSSWISNYLSTCLVAFFVALALAVSLIVFISAIA